MNPGTLAFLCAAILMSATASIIDNRFEDPAADIALLREQMASLSKDLKQSKEESKKMKTRVGALTRQMMLQQLFVEERLRSEGQSGVKQTRNGVGGTKSYHLNSHLSGQRIVAIHDHSNNIRTVGMGEFIGVLNGVEFRTRHNDYRLYMPSSNTSEYHKTEEIPFPDVPPEVASKGSLDEQVEEMIEWFKVIYTDLRTSLGVTI
jgi:hypothetical protein